MSTAGSRDWRGPTASFATACTLAPSGNHHTLGIAQVDLGEDFSACWLRL